MSKLLYLHETLQSQHPDPAGSACSLGLKLGKFQNAHIDVYSGAVDNQHDTEAALRLNIIADAQSTAVRPGVYFNHDGCPCGLAAVVKLLDVSHDGVTVLCNWPQPYAHLRLRAADAEV